MVPIEELSPGMRVKIVDQWVDGCGQNVEGLMDKFLGQVVTVLSVDLMFDSVFIEEDEYDCSFTDGGHWYWNGLCFDYIVEEEQEDFEPVSNSEILSLFWK